jgi:hypothetical protein
VNGVEAMNLFQTLERECPRRGLEFLIIGGHAVNEYGYSRETFDLDLLTRRTQQDAWMIFLTELGFMLFVEHATFVQLKAPKHFVWPVDLMLVNDQTFAKMVAEAQAIQIGSARAKVPKLQHLIALKVHALKHTRIHRFMKDFQDVVGLIDVNHLDVASLDLREIFQRYGTPDLYAKVAHSCSRD